MVVTIMLIVLLLILIVVMVLLIVVCSILCILRLCLQAPYDVRYATKSCQVGI